MRTVVVALAVLVGVRLFHAALQSTAPGSTVGPAGDDLRITDSAAPPLAAAANRLYIGPG